MLNVIFITIKYIIPFNKKISFSIDETVNVRRRDAVQIDARSVRAKLPLIDTRQIAVIV